MRRLRERRRTRIRERSFPAAWDGILDGVPLVRRLPPDDRTELHGLVQVLLAEKRFEGAGGLTVNDRIRLVIAAQAGVLLLHRPTDVFPKLATILVYPGEYAVSEEFEADDGLIHRLDGLRAGESWQTGTLVLSWDDVERDLASDLQNVVLHEFAHQLDAGTGETNGAPILADAELSARWAEAMSTAYDRLVDAAERNEETLLDPYGAENPAEFFAVATEAFFLTPVELAEDEPDLYAVLRDYYRQHPAAW